jgi:DNA-nicking Smr family endonuclease
MPVPRDRDTHGDTRYECPIMNAHDDKPRRRRLNEDERTLWDAITRSVRPLGRSLAVSPTRPAPPAHARSVVRKAAPVPKPPPRLEPLERRQKQRLARGVVPIDARLDLHGRTQGEAYAALLRFLRRAQTDGAKFALVITGKGAAARDNWIERGVLRRQVPLWLKLPEFRAYVTAFEEAHVGHGGAGALYVRLRRRRPAE